MEPKCVDSVDVQSVSSFLSREKEERADLQDVTCALKECLGLSTTSSQGNVDGEQEKKKKRKKKKKTTTTFALPEQDNSVFRRLSNWPPVPSSTQTDPPTISIRDCFPGNDYPLGEIQEYTGANSFRTTNEEKRQAEKLMADDYNDIRHAAECHRQVSLQYSGLV